MMRSQYPHIQVLGRTINVALLSHTTMKAARREEEIR